MKNKTTATFIILFMLSMFGLSQFTTGVRSVDIAGLFASGVLAGTAIFGFFAARRK